MYIQKDRRIISIDSKEKVAKILYKEFNIKPSKFKRVLKQIGAKDFFNHPRKAFLNLSVKDCLTIKKLGKIYFAVPKKNKRYLAKEKKHVQEKS